MKIKTAIQNVVNYHTLPSQIDYRVPQRNKAHEAEAFIESLPKRLAKRIGKAINRQIDAYYSPVTPEGYSVADLEEMF